MKKVTGVLLLLLLSFPAFSQDNSKVEQKIHQIEVHFDLDSYVVDSEFMCNSENLSNLSELITRLQNDSLTTISEIKINSYASPEGGRRYNEQLTKKRTNSIYDYLTTTISVPDSLITKEHSGSNWNGLRMLVEESDMQYKNEVLYIIKNIPEETWRRVKPNDRWLSLVDSRLKHLMELKYGNPYRYMSANFYPKLRSGSVVTIYFKTIAAPIIKKEIEEVVEVEEPKIEEPVEIPQIVEPVTSVSDADENSGKPIIFALKTNLLFDALLAPNIEFEIPIGDRWSVAGEWIFPWWTWDNGKSDSHRHRMQLLHGNIEGKYWFGDRTDRPIMTGWHAGLYVGGGLYDFERQGKGYQGEFFIAGGISGGYAHTINKRGNLRMEYSLGLGYMKTNYRYYEAQYDIDDRWHPIKQQTGDYTWIGPTRARVSLVWLLNFNSKKGGK